MAQVDVIEFDVNVDVNETEININIVNGVTIMKDGIKVATVGVIDFLTGTGTLTVSQDGNKVRVKYST